MWYKNTFSRADNKKTDHMLSFHWKTREIPNITLDTYILIFRNRSAVATREIIYVAKLICIVSTQSLVVSVNAESTSCENVQNFNNL